MSLFRHELKKIWNPRILLLIAALAVLVWFTILRGLLDSYESLATHGIYGAHQRELFERYGETLEPEEWAAYDVPGRKAALEAKMNALIASDPRFAEYGVPRLPRVSGVRGTQHRRNGRSTNHAVS